MPLPIVKKEIIAPFEESITLIMGPPKSGKSSFLKNVPNTIYADADKGLKYLSVFARPIETWEDFLKFVDELCNEKHDFKTVVIDTVDVIYDLCSTYICKKAKVSHESELDWGKGWKAVKTEFYTTIARLIAKRFGIFFLSHTEEKDIIKNNIKSTKTIPSLAKGGYSIVSAKCDFIFLIDFALDKEGVEQRVLRTLATKDIETGGRLVLPKTILLNYEVFSQHYEKAMAALRLGGIAPQQIVGQAPQKDVNKNANG